MLLYSALVAAVLLAIGASVYVAYACMRRSRERRRRQMANRFTNFRDEEGLATL